MIAGKFPAGPRLVALHMRAFPRPAMPQRPKPYSPSCLTTATGMRLSNSPVSVGVCTLPV